MGCNCGSGADAGTKTDFQYAVKIVCGIIPPHSGHSESAPLPPGQYFTKINIHNFSRCDCVDFRWKVAVGLPQLGVGPISEFADASLCADEALEIACADIMRMLGKFDVHIEGWVVIETPVELDVVAVYGTAPARDGHVNTFHTERVHPRCIPVCDDFHLEASTGVAIWEVAGPFQGQAPANAVFVPATLGSVDPSWANLPGCSWVHPPGPDIQPEGDYTYRLRFKLCSGFRNATMGGGFMADYYANVFLNGNLISPPQAGGPNYSSPIPFGANSQFKAGTNELIVVVHNSEVSTTGLALLASIRADNGKCADEAYPLWQCPGLWYQVHSAEFKFNPFIGMFMYTNISTEAPVSGGSQAGTVGTYRRIEELGMGLSGALPPGTELWYQVFTCNLHGPTFGWSAPQSSGIVGNSGPDNPMTAVKIWLKNAPVHCHIRYRICGRGNLGFPLGSSTWSGDAYDGAVLGSTSVNASDHRIEAIVAEIVWY